MRCLLSTRKILVLLSVFHTRQIRASGNVIQKHVELVARKNIPVLLPTDVDYITDIKVLDALTYIESLSPCKKISQRVGCILQSDESLLVTASNSFINNKGVHAEMNAISQYLNTFSAFSKCSNPPVPLVMTVSFSPCVECAALILLLPEIQLIRYVHNFGDDGIKVLEKAGLTVRELKVTDKLQARKRNIKLHPYSKVPWVPEVTDIVLSYENTSTLEGEGREIIIAHSVSDPFDVRPFIIKALKIRNQKLGSLVLTYEGILNHRERLFLEVVGVRFVTNP